MWGEGEVCASAALQAARQEAEGGRAGRCDQQAPQRGHPGPRHAHWCRSVGQHGRRSTSKPAGVLNGAGQPGVDVPGLGPGWLPSGPLLESRLEHGLQEPRRVVGRSAGGDEGGRRQHHRPHALRRPVLAQQPFSVSVDATVGSQRLRLPTDRHLVAAADQLHPVSSLHPHHSFGQHPLAERNHPV